MPKSPSDQGTHTNNVNHNQNITNHHLNDNNELHDHKIPLQCWSCTRFVGKDELFCNSCEVVQKLDHGDLFKVFKLPKRFDVDLAQLSDRFKKLQRKLHPDLHAMKSKEEQSFSADQSSSLNHAYNVLKTPHLRAEYLLGLNGIDIGESMGTITDPELLMGIMELREAVEEGSTDELKSLGENNRRKIDEILKLLADAFSKNDLENAKSHTIKLRYLEKAQEEIINKLGIHV